MYQIGTSFGIGIVIILIILSIILGALIFKMYYDYKLEKKGKDIQSLIKHSNEQANKILEKAREKAEKSAERIIEKAEKQASSIIRDIEEKQMKLNEKEIELLNKEKEIENIIKEEENKLYEISNINKEDAKKLILEKIEKEYHNDFTSYIEKIKKETEENAKKEASSIIAKTLYRVSIENSNNFLVESVELPSEDYKGRIIGREGRNIQFFEKLTGVNISMDDTPEIIKISSFDPEKRFIAKITLEKLIKDGRINPVYIEKYFNETKKELPEILKEIGKETLLELGIPMMHADILEYIGRFELRYSYGQNLLSHSKEVSRISELIASELGFDSLLAKKAGLLHDIGKIDVQSGESHAKVGANILRKYDMNEIIVNAAESHHFEVEQTHPISWIVTAADAISAGREGVRNNNTERYIERIKGLENLVLNIDGVKKAYIMQAGREIWAFIDEEKISDLDVYKLNKKIKDKVEENLDYPGIIKVVSIRENKVIDYIG